MKGGRRSSADRSSGGRARVRFDGESGAGVGGVERASDPIALGGGATEPSQELELRFCLDAFGGHCEVEGARESDHRLADGGVVAPFRQIAHESAVDLEPTDGQAADEVERGTGGAKIVEHDFRATRMQSLQRPGGFVDHGERGRFGNFDLHLPGGQGAGGERPVEERHERGVAKLLARNVDGDARRSRPRSRLAAGLVEYPFAEVVDEAVLLGDVDEVERRNEAEPGMAPATMMRPLAILASTKNVERRVTPSNWAVRTRSAMGGSRSPAL